MTRRTKKAFSIGWLIVAAAVAMGLVFGRHLLDWAAQTAKMGLTPDIATILALALMAMLALGYLLPTLRWERSFTSSFQAHREVLAGKQLTNMVQRIQAYQSSKGRPPASLAEVGFSDRLLINPWGRPYRYQADGKQFSIQTDMPSNLVEPLPLPEAPSRAQETGPASAAWF